MPRVTGQQSKSPAKKAAKSPKTPRKKSKTPSRKPSKSPARSQATTPKKTTVKNTAVKTVNTPRARSRSASRSISGRKSPAQGKTSKSTAVKARTPSTSPPKSPPSRKTSTRSRSSSRTIASKRQASPIQVIKHKIQKAIPDIFSVGTRSRRAAYDSDRFVNNNAGGSTTSQLLRRAGPNLWQRVRLGANRFARGGQRRFGYANVKRHFKRNWRKYVTAVAVVGAAYYTYHNQRQIQKALQEQYNKLSALIEQRKESTFSKYFNGWITETPPSTTTEVPVIIPPRTVEEPPQPPHTHSTIVV